MNLQPKYTQKPIGSIEALANLLNLPLQDLEKLIVSSNDDYIVANKIEKDDGSLRVTYKAKPNAIIPKRKLGIPKVVAIMENLL